MTRDYSLRTELPAARGWYRSALSREQLRALLERRDGPALRDTALLFLLMGLSAYGGIALWGSVWCLPFWAFYGVLYGSAMDSRWHECGHGTAFKTPWMNRTLYHIASFMMMRNPVVWKWAHARHHSDTIHVGRDPEIQLTRPPPAPWRIALDFFGVFEVPFALRRMLRNAWGQIDAPILAYMPATDQHKAFAVARVWCAIYAATIAVAWVWGSWLPLMLIGLPRLYGAWHHKLLGLLQHEGLADNVRDFRLNTRTLYINRVSRFIYWNMNYHIEHHMYPMVPYHALPALHEAIKADCPEPNRSIWQAYRSLWPVVKRQRQHPDYYLERPLPSTAQSYVYS